MIDIAQGGVVEEVVATHGHVVFGVGRRVEGHEDVGHDTAPAVNLATLH